MMDEKERDYVILRTYRSVWKIDRKIYSLENIKLLIPVNPDELIYFLLSVGLTIGLIKLLPFLNKVPFILRYGALPYGLMKFFTKQKLDGKLPHKFFIDYSIYMLSPKRMEGFRAVTEYKTVKFSTPLVMRDIEIVNKTEKALKDKKKKGFFSKKDHQKKAKKKVKHQPFKPGKKMRKEA